MQRRLVIVVLFAALSLTTSAHAGVADSPLPVLLAGSSTQHLFTVPGVLGAGSQLATLFQCTSMEPSATVQVGVELFAAPGGGPDNNAATSSLSVGPGQTVTFATTNATAFGINSILGASFGKGSARIRATSKKLASSVFVTSTGSPPVTGMVQLTIIAKTTQKAQN